MGHDLGDRTMHATQDRAQMLAELEAAAATIAKFQAFIEGPRPPVELSEAEVARALPSLRKAAKASVGMLDTAGCVSGFEVLEDLADLDAAEADFGSGWAFAPGSVDACPAC